MNPKTAEIGHAKRILSTAALVAALGLLAYLCFWNVTARSVLFQDDTATSFSVARAMLAGETVLLGPPSHSGGRHLGPLYYWYVALCLKLVGNQVVLAVALGSVFKLLAIVGLAILSISIAGSSWAALGTIVWILADQYIFLIRQNWHSNFLLIPETFFFVATFAVLRYRMRALLLYLLAGSLLLQTHFSSLPLLATTTLVVLIRLLTGRADSQQHYPSWTRRRWQSVFGLLALASWCPLFVYELNYRSNLLQLASEHLNASHRHSGMISAVSALLEFVQVFTGAMDIKAFLGGATLPLLLLFVAALCIIVADLLRNGGPALRWMCLVVVCSPFAYLIFLSRLAPPLHLYYLYAPALLLALSLGVLFGHSAKILGQPTAMLSPTKVAAVLVLLGSGLGAGVRTEHEISKLAGTSPFGEFGTYQHAIEVASILGADADRPDESFRIVVRGERNGTASAYYFILGPPYDIRHFYNAFFREIPSFQRAQAAPESIRKNLKRPGKLSAPTYTYLLVCSSNDELALTRARRKLGEQWHFNAELPTANCKSCEGCRLQGFRRSGNRRTNALDLTEVKVSS